MLTLAELEKSLQAKYGALGMPELLLRRPGLTDEQVEEVEASFGRLPEEFRQLVKQYDFSNLHLRVFFGMASSDYRAWLFDTNSENKLSTDPKWWGTSSRPPNFLSIGGTDPHIVLLNTQNGRVYSFFRDEEWRKCLLIAADFELFLRGVGFLALENYEDIPNSAVHLLKKVGADENARFWGFY